MISKGNHQTGQFFKHYFSKFQFIKYFMKTMQTECTDRTGSEFFEVLICFA